MLESYISQLKYSSIKDDKIKAIELPIEGLNAYLYYDYSKQLHFIIKSNEIIHENRRGIKVMTSNLDLIEYGCHSFIDVICTHEEFKKEFTQIIGQIIEYFNINNDLIKAIKFTINKWYYFFEKDTNIALSESDVKGLIGELLFIIDFSKKLSYKNIIDAWKGPESGLRDFNFETFDVEIKTSSKEIGHVHTINGQIQLKSTIIPLYVYSVSLKKSDSHNSLTLKKLIDEICFEIGNDSFLLNDFFEKLELLNVLLTKIEEYNKYSYELKNILTIKIDNINLNKFIIDNKNTRISNLKYDYDFNGLINEEIEISI
ncbi:MAG: PD-(D/E)XK motif protein [Bacteroidota bacterium]